MIKKVAFFLVILSPFVLKAQKNYTLISSGENIFKGNKCIAEGEYDQAIGFFEKVNQSDTNYHIAQYNKIISLFSNKQYIELEKTSIKSLENENDYSSKIYRLYISSLINRKSFDKAREVILEATDAFPLCFEYEHQLAIILIQEKKIDEAIKLLQKIINVHPQHSKSHYELAKIKADQGYVAEAILGFEMAIISNRSSVVIKESYLAMEDVMNNNYEVIEKYKGENDFKLLDQMIQSKVALKENYKSKLGLNYIVDRQTDLLMSQFSFKAKDNSFGINYYGKFLNELIKKGFQEEYILYILGVIKSKEIDKKKKKHAVELRKFKLFLKKYWHEHQNNFKYDIKGVVYKGEYNYNYEGELFGIGSIKNKKNVGEWTFFYKNGAIKSKLSYNQNGELNGDCSWFDTYGNKTQSGKYKNGVNEGFANFSRANNCNWYSGNFVNDKLVGEFKLFRTNGSLLETKTLKDNKLNGPWKEFSKSGIVIRESDYKNGKLDGEYKAFYDNGSILSKSYNIEGEADGVFKRHHLNGKIEIQGQFESGRKKGKWKSYYYNGSLSSEYEFNKKGKITGKEIRYSPNGDTTLIINYLNGFSNRVEFDYGHDNRLLWEHHYKKDKLKKFISYDTAGLAIPLGDKEYVLYDSYGFKHIVATLKNGEFNGLHNTYWKNGSLKKSKTYEKGVLNGKVTTFYESGELNEKYYMKNGNYHGTFESFHVSGKEQTKGHYYNGLKSGEWKFYNKNGSLSQIEFFLDGKLDGILLEYNNVGLKEYETKYNGGVIVRTDVFHEDGQLLKRYLTPMGNGDYSLVSSSGKKRLSGNLKGGNHDGEIIYYYPNGKIEEIRRSINGVYHGENLSYYPNGSIRSKSKFVYGYKEGKFISYYKNGNKYWEATYEHGLIRDSSVYYYESGEKEKCYYYDFKGDDTKHISYHKNGRIASIKPIVNGFIHGIRTRFDKDGMLMVSRKYNGGELYAYSYMKNDSLLPYINIRRNDKLEPRYNNGKKSEEHNIKNGLYHGFYARYFSNGNIWIESNYIKGWLEGKHTEYYPNGKLKSQGDYSFGELNGFYIEFYEGGEVKRKTNYLFGKKHGVNKNYTKEGKLISTITYKDNVVVDIK